MLRRATDQSCGAEAIFAKGRAKAKAERKVKRVMRDCMVERSRREGYR